MDDQDFERHADRHLYCVYLNGMINKDPRKLRRFSKIIQPRPLKQLLFALNVGASHGKTFLETDEQKGCHWTCGFNCEENYLWRFSRLAYTRGFD